MEAGCNKASESLSWKFPPIESFKTKRGDSFAGSLSFGAQMKLQNRETPWIRLDLASVETTDPNRAATELPEIENRTSRLAPSNGSIFPHEISIKHLIAPAAKSKPKTHASPSSEQTLHDVRARLEARLECLDFLLTQKKNVRARRSFPRLSDELRDQAPTPSAIESFETSTEFPTDQIETENCEFALLEYSSYNRTSIMRDTYKADLLARQGQVEQAVTLLKAIVKYDPDNALIRLKLRRIYLQAGLMDLASNETLQLSRIEQTRHETFASEDSETRNDGELNSTDSVDRRMLKRMPLSLPLLAISDAGQWQEFTETIDVNQTGLMIRLTHPVEVGMKLRIKTPMPKHLRIHSRESRLYDVNCVVRHTKREKFGWNLVGVDFEIL